jgi:hypothetical protein
MEKLEKTYLEQGFNYEAYRKMMQHLIAKGKTTGPNQSPEIIEFTKLNEHRMARLDKTAKINDSLAATVQSLQKKWIWIILTEIWCGDAAQNLPTIEKIAAINPLITTHYLLRDETPSLMIQYLTNGAKAIPKLICYDGDTLEYIWHWGPRPAPAQELTMSLLRHQPPLSFEEVHEPLHKWYAEDKTNTLQKEMEDLIKQSIG